VANGEKTLGQLPEAEQASLMAGFAEAIHQLTIHPDFAGTPFNQYIDKIEDWIVSLGLPRDIGLAAQVALAEYGEFATPDDFDDCPISNVIQLIKVVETKKEWERKIAARKDRNQTPAQPRNDEPTEAYLLVGRKVLAGMARNPSVESFREAVRGAGLKGSNAKLGKLLSHLKGERLKK
jgi:hypothetical protein